MHKNQSKSFNAASWIPPDFLKSKIEIFSSHRMKVFLLEIILSTCEGRRRSNDLDANFDATCRWWSDGNVREKSCENFYIKLFFFFLWKNGFVPKLYDLVFSVTK